jgi:outer membrane lipoprotein-sorting protein
MHSFQRAALGLALLFAVAQAQALTASELVAKNIEAKGGAAALQSVKSLRREGRLIVNDGQFVLELLETKQRPSSIRTEISMQGLSQVQSYDGKEGWRIDPFGGRKDPERMPADDVREYAEDATIDGVLADASAAGHKIEYLGTEDIDGTLAHKLKVTRADGAMQYVYLDPDYFLEIRVESQSTVRGVKRTSVTDFGNYEKVGGVFWPLSVEAGIKGQGNPAKYEYRSAVVDPDIDPSYFSFPAAAKK